MDEQKKSQLEIIIEKNETYRQSLKSEEFKKNISCEKTECSKKRYRDKNKEYIKFLNKLYYDKEYHKSYRNNKEKIVCKKCIKKFTKYTFDNHICLTCPDSP